jgi:hypothetical protein
MNDIPEFEDAVACFRRFLAEEGLPSQIRNLSLAS